MMFEGLLVIVGTFVVLALSLLESGRTATQGKQGRAREPLVRTA